MATVLVVDDSSADRALVGKLLEKQPGCAVEYAADGVEALEQVKRATPDLIVTDLRMPRMDGLELVGAIRTDYPAVPVILITAHGSEMLAVEALRQGAAGYVPKSQLVDKLPGTVEEVLALARADRDYQRMVGRLSKSDFTFFLELENDLAMVDPLIELVKQSVASLRLCDSTGQLRVGVALKEALVNAICRGNLEIGFEQMEAAQADLGELAEERRSQAPYRDRSVYIDVRISRNEARFVVRDEGPGFDVTAIPDLRDSTTGQAKCGRGLSLMRSFMDEVTFNAVGNQVTMVKRPDALQGNAAKTDS